MMEGVIAGLLHVIRVCGPVSYTHLDVYKRQVYYPKFAVDCFALLKEIVGSYLEQTEVLEQ